MTFFHWQLLLISFFFVVSTVFSASETALTSLSRPRIKKLISQKPGLAAALSEWLATPQYLLTTILIGNTLCNVFITILTVDLALLWFPNFHHGWVETGAWLILTVVMFVFADFVPKSLARHYPQRVALASIHFVSALNRRLTPFLRVVLGFLDKFEAFEGAPVGKLSVYSLEEVREMIQASALEGQLPPRSTQMMEGVLRLSQIPVSRIMTPIQKVESVNLGQDPEQVLDQVAEIGHTRVPVYRVDPRRIGGYLHAKDLLYVWRGALPLQLDMLVRKPLTVSSDYVAGNLLEDFRKGTSHLAVVSGAAGESLGIVSLQDVLEEIVGEILDETDLNKRS